jgi:hypothetical protein
MSVWPSALTSAKRAEVTESNCGRAAVVKKGVDWKEPSPFPA